MNKPKDWWTNPHNLHVLLCYMADQCSDIDEIRRVIAECTEKPWHWETEFIVATCRQRDARAA